jgi:hypothetical protein
MFSDEDGVSQRWESMLLIEDGVSQYWKSMLLVEDGVSQYWEGMLLSENGMSQCWENAFGQRKKVSPLIINILQVIMLVIN